MRAFGDVTYVSAAAFDNICSDWLPLMGIFRELLRVAIRGTTSITCLALPIQLVSSWSRLTQIMLDPKRLPRGATPQGTLRPCSSRDRRRKVFKQFSPREGI